MSFFTWKGSNHSENIEHAGHNLQDGLFQIASQTCHILVQVSLIELNKSKAFFVSTFLFLFCKFMCICLCIYFGYFSFVIYSIY